MLTVCSKVLILQIKDISSTLDGVWTYVYWAATPLFEGESAIGGGHAFSAVAPPVGVNMAAEAEMVMVVGAGRFHHQLEVLAADSTRCRPLRFRSRRQTAGRRKPYCNL